MKTLAEILAEDVDEIIRTANAINKLIEDTKKSGVKWPELEKKDYSHLCTICHTNYVDSDNGYDTCQNCLNNI